jgi:hypothetical protein
VQIRWKSEWPAARAHRLKNLLTRISAKLNIHRRPPELNTTGDQSVRVVEELHTEDQDPPPEAVEQEQLAEPTEEVTRPKSPITSLTVRHKPIVEPETLERAISHPSFGSLPPRVEGREIVVISSDESDSDQEQSPKDSDHSPSPSPIPAGHDRRAGPFRMKITPAPPSSLLEHRKEPIARSSSAEPVLEGRRPKARYFRGRDSSPEAQSSPSPPQPKARYFRGRDSSPEAQSSPSPPQPKARYFRGRDPSPEAQSSPGLPKYLPPRRFRNKSHGELHSQPSPEYDQQVWQPAKYTSRRERLSRDHRLSLPFDEDIRQLGRNYRVRPASDRLSLPFDEDIRQLGRSYRVRPSSSRS